MLIFTATVLLVKSSKPEIVRLEENIIPKNNYIASELIELPNRLCLLWISTRDNVLRKHNLMLKNSYRYGLQFHVPNNMAHLTLIILLAGDIATNPGPFSGANHTTNLQQKANDRKFSAKCLVVNARSLLSIRKSEGKRSCHLANFQELVYTENADIIWVTETWLRDDVENSEILPWGYTIYRKDRKSRAGGVLLAVKSSSFSSSRKVNFNTNLELITIELTSGSNMKYLLCCCYKSQQFVSREWIEMFNLFLGKCCFQYSNMLICGDFNLPNINWESPELTTGVDEVQFSELLYDYHLTQLNTLPTRGHNLLDLVITNVPSQVVNISVLSPAESGLITDHSVITFNIKTSVKAVPKVKRTVFDYRKGNFNGLRTALEGINLCDVIESEVDVNHGWLKWKEIFLDAVRKNIPIRTIKNINSPPWINSEIIHAIKKKETVRRKLKSTPSDVLRVKFKELRAKVKQLVSYYRAHFFQSLDADLHTNPKRFWSLFKLKTKDSTVPGNVSLGASESDSAPVRSASCPRDIAEVFNDYFASVLNTDDDQTNSSTGPDGISPRLLMETAHQIAPSLCTLFNRSLDSGFLPEEWKLANIIPVFKKGDKTHVENYRPISLLCVVSKVFERCILNKLSDHLLKLVNSSQHGFIPGRSCTTQLVEVLNHIGSLLDSGKQTDVIFMDMSKAFDKVNHAALINKLSNYGIRGSLLNWFSHYLHGRLQRVTTLGATSSKKPVSSGVPQGSILGPILFLLYVNDLPDAVQNARVASFADDTKIFHRVDSTSDAVLLQNDLSNLEKWSSTSGLVFNQLKCKCLRVTRKTQPVTYPYHIKDKELTTTSFEKDLGIWIASDLTWTKHVLERCAKANRLLGFVRRSGGEITNVKTRRMLYLSVVRSVLGYASQVWSPQTIGLIKRTERVQRRASKFMLNLSFLWEDSYRDRLIRLELIPLSYWHEYMDLLFFFKAINGLVDISGDVLPKPIIPTRVTRSTSTTQLLFRPQKCRTTTFQKSYISRVTRVWNCLPPHLRQPNMSLSSFKRLLRDYYLEALHICYDAEDPKTWKSVCLTCNSCRSLNTVINCCP